MNTIYKKGKRNNALIKAFELGKLEDAMKFGWELAYENPKDEFFIITEKGKCLRFNKQIIL